MPVSGFRIQKPTPNVKAGISLIKHNPHITFPVRCFDLQKKDFIHAFIQRYTLYEHFHIVVNVVVICYAHQLHFHFISHLPVCLLNLVVMGTEPNSLKNHHQVKLILV